MWTKITRLTLTALLAGGLTQAVHAGIPATLDVDVNRAGHTIPAAFYGLMTEEINHAYDGGLFAELIQNRTFQDPGRAVGGAPVHWSVIGSGTVSTDRTDPVNKALPVSLKLELSGDAAGVANDGYWGIPVKPNTTYTASFYAKGGDGFSGPITASLLTDEGDITVAKADTKPVTGQWVKYTVKLKTASDAKPTTKARFVLSAKGTGAVWFSMVSLFPPTYRNTPNGLRADLMQLMADMKVKFIRLPGGNYVEGGSFADRFNWLNMIGPADQRPGHMGCWGYRSSDGFGMPEYLLWCKQLGAEPVLALFAGYVLNGQHVDAGSPEMAQYTQEALDEIEYVCGPATSKWGKQRAADGFVEPFALRYVEIGNEDWFDRSGSYDGRFTQMAKAIRARYPHLKIIATAPVKSFKPDLYDDHFYRGAHQLFQMATMYDKPTTPGAPVTFNGGGWSGRQPDGIKTFVGEWAAQEGRPTPNLTSALADAAFVMGLERNSDAVDMECYAPLLVNVNPDDPAKGYPRGWQWNTNLIGYDAMGSFGSPSYYAQAMLGQNRGDLVLPAKFTVKATAQKAGRLTGKIGVGTWHSQVEYSDITVTDRNGKTLLTPNAIGAANSWSFTGDDWTVQDQTISIKRDTESWALIGDKGWTDYTIKLRARKLGGREGFIVLFHAVDGSNYRWWNVGGWGNTVTRCESAENDARNPYGKPVNFTVENDRWYDLRLEVTGNRVRGFVDDKLVTDSSYEATAGPSTPLFATATYSKSDRTVLVKVVNYGSDTIEMAVNLKGVGSVQPKATAIVLQGDPTDVNTLAEPRKVAPSTQTITVPGASFTRAFAPHSFTILRLKTTGK